MWVEVVVYEITRVVEWPLVTLKHDHVSLQPSPQLGELEELTPVKCRLLCHSIVV